MVEHDKCCGCGACASICPQNCIELKPDKLGFLYPDIDNASCIHCAACDRVCPVLHKGDSMDRTPRAWGGHVRSDSLRRDSSSGGLFSLFAENVLNNNGVVFGAAMSEDCSEVNHIKVERLEELSLLRGSKYVQSNIGETYCQAREFLKTGRTVLFSGTPCQIDGLRLFLGKCYENLLTIEIICHGTPSPRLFKKYIRLMEKKLKDRINKISFRDEIGGIPIMKIETSCGRVYKKNKFEDIYYRLFLSNMCLRESCYQCPSRGLHERADITLSDFWGVENVAPDIVDGGGLSLVVAHTEKGRSTFDEIKDQCIGHEVNFYDSIKGNMSFFKSYQRPKMRDEFERDIDNMGVDQLEWKYTLSFKGKIKRILQFLGLFSVIKKLKMRF